MGDLCICGTALSSRVDGLLSNALGERFCSPDCKQERDEQLGARQCALDVCRGPQLKGTSPCAIRGLGEVAPLFFCCTEHRETFRLELRRQYTESGASHARGGRPTTVPEGNLQRVSVGLSPSGADMLAAQAVDVKRSKSSLGAELLEDALLLRAAALT